MHDVLLTRQEYQAIADWLADSDAPSTGETSLTDWIAEHGQELARSYANELTRHYRRPACFRIRVAVASS